MQAVEGEGVPDGGTNKLKGKKAAQAGLPSAAPVCKQFLTSGACKFGDHCSYQHISNDATSATAAPPPWRRDAAGGSN